MRVVILRERVSIAHFVRGSVDIFEGYSEDYMYLFLFSILDTFILVHGSCDHYWRTLYLSSLYVDVCFFHLPLTCVVSFLSLCTYFLYVYAIYYFCFTLRCLDEFCLKCFRNTGYQNLLIINSLLAMLFKSLCQDRFYCIQQVSMSWVIYDFSHMFICLLWFCHRLPRGRLLGHMCFTC